MAASRINAALDGPSMALIHITKAVVLAGERVMPRTTARSAHDLARAARSALEAQETGLASSLLKEIQVLFDGVTSEYVDATLRKVTSIEGTIAFYTRDRVPAVETSPQRARIAAAV